MKEQRLRMRRSKMMGQKRRCLRGSHQGPRLQQGLQRERAGLRSRMTARKRRCLIRSHRGPRLRQGLPRKGAEISSRRWPWTLSTGLCCFLPRELLRTRYLYVYLGHAVAWI